jgi:hypothetical protein
MAAPNIANVATITGKSKGLTLTATGSSQLIGNTASSGKVFKVNWVVAVNKSSAEQGVTLIYDNGTTEFEIAYNVTVPAHASIILVDRNAAVYLEEDTALIAGMVDGTPADDVVFTCSYEEIS